MIITYTDTEPRQPETPNLSRSSSFRHRTNRTSRNALSGSVARRNIARKAAAVTSPVDDPATFSIPRRYRITWDLAEVEKYICNWEDKAYLRLKPERLKWSPFLLARAQAQAAAAAEIVDGGSNDKTALVEHMLRRAEQEVERLRVELATMEREELEKQAAQAALEQQDNLDERLMQSPRSTNGFIPSKAPRSRTNGVGMTRTRSLRDFGDSASRGSRSRAASLSDGDDAGSQRSSVRRLRTRPSVGPSVRQRTTSARKRKSTHEDSSFEEEEEDSSSDEEAPARRPLRRTTSATASSSHVLGDSDDSEAPPDTDGERPSTPTPKLRRTRSMPNGSIRRSSVNGKAPGEHTKKKRRIESSPEQESEPEPDPQPARRRTRQRDNSEEEGEASPVKTRLRNRRGPSPPASDLDTPRKSLRSSRRQSPAPRPRKSRKSEADRDAEAQVEDAIRMEQDSPEANGAEAREDSLSPVPPSRPNLFSLDFEGSLSSAGPETEDEQDMSDVAPGEELPDMGATAPPRSVDALVLLAQAADYVAPHSPSKDIPYSAPEIEASLLDNEEANQADAEGEVDEMDAEGEADWD